MRQAVPPEEVRRTTEEVLARPEFREDPLSSLFGRLLEWFLEDLPRWSLANPALARVLALVLTLVVLALFTHIVYTFVREFAMIRKRAEAGSSGSAGATAALGEVGARNWQEAIGMARAALDAGDAYRALWIIHRCLLSVLDARGLVRFTRWKTNADYLRECPGDAPAAGLLDEATRAYERVVYAHQGIGSPQATDLLDRVASLAGGASR
jgi:hypothetical protein